MILREDSFFVEFLALFYPLFGPNSGRSERTANAEAHHGIDVYTCLTNALLALVPFELTVRGELYICFEQSKVLPRLVDIYTTHSVYPLEHKARQKY